MLPIVWLCLFVNGIVTIPSQDILAFPSTKSKHDRLGAVASENRLCSQIGIDLLKAGGNAADAVCLNGQTLLAKLTSSIACRDHSLYRSCWYGNQSTRKLAGHALNSAQIVTIAGLGVVALLLSGP